MWLVWNRFQALAWIWFNKIKGSLVNMRSIYIYIYIYIMIPNEKIIWWKLGKNKNSVLSLQRRLSHCWSLIKGVTKTELPRDRLRKEN